MPDPVPSKPPSGRIQSLTLFCAAAAVAAATALPFFPTLAPKPHAPEPRPAPTASARPRAGHRRVLVIVLDGVGVRVSYRPGSMPLLQRRLAGEAAWGTGLASFPTLTPSGLRAIFCGRHSVPEAELPGAVWAREPDSVLLRAASAGLTVVGVGQHDWSGLFADHGEKLETLEYTTPGPDYDVGVFAKAKDLLSRGDWDLAGVHFFGLDPYAHVHGTEGPEYAARLRAADRKVQALSDLAGPRTAVIVVSDHGQAPNGSHGGMSKSAREATLVLWGDGIRPGPLGERPLVDVAPTIAALLGVPPPITTEGLPILDALKLTSEQRARLLARILETRAQRWLEAQLRWAFLGVNPDGSVREVLSLLRKERWAKAADEALHGIEAIDNSLVRATPSYWFGRMVVAEGMVLLALALSFLGGGRPSRRASAGAAGLTVLFLCSLTAPLLWPGLWILAPLSALGAAAGLLVLTAASTAIPEVEGDDWVAVGAVVLGLSIPSIIDPPLWAVAALAAVWLRRRPAGWTAAVPWLAAGAALAAGWALSPEEWLGQTSAVRELLPSFPAAARVVIPGWVPAASAAALAGAMVYSLEGERPLRRLLLSAAAAAPFAWAANAPENPVSAAVGAALIAASAALIWPARVGRRAKGLWLAALALAVQSILAIHARGPRLLLAVFVGWGLSYDEEAPSAPWAGLRLAALVFFGYSLAGYHTDFSNISLGTIYGSFGTAQRIRTLGAIVAARELSALGAPVLALAGAAGEIEPLSALTCLGAVSLGNVIELWIELSTTGRSAGGLIADECVARALFAAVLAWIVVAWRAADASRNRLRKTMRDRDEAPARVEALPA